MDIRTPYTLRDEADYFKAYDPALLPQELDQGPIPCDPQPVDLARLVRGEIDRQIPVAQKKFQQLLINSIEELIVWGNVCQLQQTLSMLLSNAIVYTPEGGRIRCDCQLWLAPTLLDITWPGSSHLSAGSWAALRVVDTNPDIEAGSLPHLFVPHIYAPSPDPTLEIRPERVTVIDLIERNRGRIGIAGISGQGTTFAIYYPLWEESRY